MKLKEMPSYWNLKMEGLSDIYRIDSITCTESGNIFNLKSLQTGTTVIISGEVEVKAFPPLYSVQYTLYDNKCGNMTFDFLFQAKKIIEAYRHTFKNYSIGVLDGGSNGIYERFPIKE